MGGPVYYYYYYASGEALYRTLGPTKGGDQYNKTRKPETRIKYKRNPHLLIIYIWVWGAGRDYDLHLNTRGELGHIHYGCSGGDIKYFTYLPT